MSDPFATLRLFSDFSPGRVSQAFAESLQRGVPMHEARRAMDVLRDDRRREAAALLAPSMSQAAVRERSKPPATWQAAEATSTLMRILRLAIDEIDADLVRAVRPPHIERDVRQYLPLPSEARDEDH